MNDLSTCEAVLLDVRTGLVPFTRITTREKLAVKGSNDLNPRKGGAFNLVPETHDATDEMAAYKLADEPFPGKFGIFYQVNRPTKNKLEADIIAKMQEKVKGLKDWQILQQNFDRMK